MPRIGTRLLGVGLAAGLAVVSLGLALTGRLALYINPASNAFVIAMALVLLVGAALSFALPLGAEADHGHDHGDAHGDDHAAAPAHGHDHAVAPAPLPRWSRIAGAGRADPHDGTTPDGADARARGSRWSRIAGAGRADPHDGTTPDAERRRSARPVAATTGRAATAVGGGLALATVGAMLVLPPASLSAELAMSRGTGAAPLFAGSDVLQLATVGDTASFGVGDWASAFASATDPAAFDGDQVTLTGFVTPAASGFDLTRLVITHCVIDAQPASVAVTVDGAVPSTGQWVSVTGTVRSTSGGALSIVPTAVETIAEPSDPYEY